MERFMKFCRNWRSDKCHPDVMSIYPQQIGNSEEIPLQPVGEELKRLDEICKTCESRFFEIEEDICPVCGNTDFIKKSLKVSNEETKKREILYFICENCETKLELSKLYPL